MTIKGSYKMDDNFVTVFDDAAKTVYTEALSTGEWRSVSVGERTAMGSILTADDYAELRSGCTEAGAFDIELSAASC